MSSNSAGEKTNTPSGDHTPRRVLFVIGSLELGGAEQHLVQVARMLKARGWDPEFFVFTRGGPLTCRLELEKIPVLGVSMPAWLEQLVPSTRIKARLRLMFLIASMMRAMIARKNRIVHFFLPGAYLLGGISAFLTRTHPRVMSRRSMNNYQTAHPIYARLERIFHPHMDKICGNSVAVIDQLKSEGVREDQLVLLYNGIDLGQFDAVADRQVIRNGLGVSPESLVLIVVANLIPYKGHHDLIQALALISEELPTHWVCLCVGRDDGILHQLQTLAIELGVSHHLQWLGSRSDVADLLTASDIGILCSHEEGFSNAVLEGMAAALPMVVTDVGGNAEAVQDGITGRVVLPRNPRSLAAAILELALNPSIRQEMGTKGRQRVESNFDMTSCVSAYEALYNQFRT